MESLMDTSAENEEIAEVVIDVDVDEDTKESIKILHEDSGSTGKATLVPASPSPPEEYRVVENMVIIPSTGDQPKQAILYELDKTTGMLVPKLPIQISTEDTNSTKIDIPIKGTSEHYGKEDTRYSSVRKNPRLYMCGYCNKRYTSRSSVYFHIRQHHEDKGDGTESSPVFQCSECDKTFVCKSSLSQHKNLKHYVGNIFKCHYSECKMAFNTAGDLTRHLRTHSGEKPFECDKCGKGFTCKSSLHFHLKTHGEKQWKCEFCEKKFNTKSDLDRHESTHTGKKNWQCVVCIRCYSCKSALKLHIKNKHAKLVTSKEYKCLNKPKDRKSTLTSAEVLELFVQKKNDVD